jgi:predicted CXXCH cytochrome family protein
MNANSGAALGVGFPAESAPVKCVPNGTAGLAPNSNMKSKSTKLLVLLSCVAVVITLVSCSTVTRTVMAPPEIPGAKFVGSQTCAECHAPISKHFADSDHARLKAPGDNAINVGCESCHGPGSIHNKTGGAARTIVNPRKSPETCFVCHLDKQGQFGLPHHHPVVEGKMSCGDCHSPHEGRAVKGGGTSLASADATCIKCHTAQHGPFVFEHEALREGCTTCHQPHGSVNQKMLTQRNSTLCLKCHFQQQVAGGTILIGGQNHTDFLRRGTCWSGGCHEAPHGSQINRSLRF